MRQSAVIMILGCILIGSPALAQTEDEDPLVAMAQNIPGVPGEDYPIFAQPPDSSFSCSNQVPGYYADKEAQCQMYHICAGPENRLVKYDFLCPNGTLFDQQYFVCNWWFNVDCSQADKFYSLNSDVLAAMIAASPKEEQESTAAERRIDTSAEQEQRTAKSATLDAILDRSQELEGILGKPNTDLASSKKPKAAVASTTTTTSLPPVSLTDLVGRPNSAAEDTTTASPPPLHLGSFEAVPGVPASLPAVIPAVPAVIPAVPAGVQPEEEEEAAEVTGEEDLGSAEEDEGLDEEGDEDLLEGSGYRRK